MSSPSNTFRDRLVEFAHVNASWLVVGLDPEPSRLPDGFSRDAHGIVSFNRELIAATQQFALGYKLNFAFYESLGRASWNALEATRSAIPASLMAIADAKRGDIADTSRLYADAIFNQLGFDAVTLSPYVGREGLMPFLDYQEREASCFAEPAIAKPILDRPCGQRNSFRVRGKNRDRRGQNVGLVVGATDMDALRRVRSIVNDRPLLVPGVGAQGATIEDAFRSATDASGRNAMISASRSIIYASGGSDFASAAALQAEALRTAMSQIAERTESAGR